MSTVIHNIPPVFDGDSEILILGSFPSVKSREAEFFYGHPQNRFWKVTAQIFGCDIPKTTEEKKAFLLKNHVALWDVVGSCEIEGSADSTIKDVVPNDIEMILNTADISQIFVNGKTAEKYYRKYIQPKINRTAVCLPSTSPANAAKSLDDLVKEWRVIKPICFR